MPIGPIRVKQTTSTTGTGTLTLNAASSGFRSFLTGFGSGTFPVRYILQRDGVFEVGYGTYNSTAGTLTRATVAASSNANALVSLAAGTTDVYFDYLPGDRQVRTISANTTLDLTDLGNLVRCTQAADITVTLPAVAAVPGAANRLSSGYSIRNAGSSGSVVWIATNGAETLDGSASAFPLFGGETITLIALDTVWMSVNRPTGWRQARRSSASTSASVDLTLPLYPGAQRSQFRVEYRNVRGTADGSGLLIRMSPDGGTTIRTSYSQNLIYGAGATSVGAASSGANTAFNISTDMDMTSGGHHVTGGVSINPGAGGLRRASIYGQSWAYSDGGWGAPAGARVMVFAGHSDAAEDINWIRFMMDTGNVLAGDFLLLSCYD